MLVKMKTSAAYAGDTLNPGEVFDLPDAVAQSMIDGDLADATREGQTRSIMGAVAVVAAVGEGSGGSDAAKVLCADHTLAELREMYEVSTGEKPGNKTKAQLAEVVAAAAAGSRANAIHPEDAASC